MLKKRPIKENSDNFVDKTLLIKEFLDIGGKVTLVTRPKGFGKSVNVSMLAEFFDMTKDSQKLFKGTQIMDTSYVSEINQYPVIYLSFANAKGTKEDVVQGIKDQLQKEYAKYAYVFENMNEYEQSDYERIKVGLLASDNGNLSDVNRSIAFLMSRLKKLYHKNVMVFIDGYDTPFIESHIGGFYKDIKGPLSMLFRTALKSSDDLQFAFLTGVQYVEEGALDNARVYTVANNAYAKYFGFTAQETEELLKCYGLELTDEVGQKSGGYRIGHQDIYNPRLLMNYVHNCELGLCWMNTSEVVMIRNVLKEVVTGDDSFIEQCEDLIAYGKIKLDAVLGISFYENASMDILWGLLINAGYSTIDEEVGDDEYQVRVPNKEIEKDFIKLIEHHLLLKNSD